MTGPVHVDRSKLDDLRALDRPGHEGFLARIATVFLDDADRRLEQMDRALESSDPEAVVMAAHTLKGSCSYLGAVRLAELCRAFEERADKGNLEAGTEAAEEIRRELATVKAVLTEEMNKK
ncbi:MAG TPA: Hpt domain-containing protein [Actinomycetota bacterium]|nr:Hpt domain-containing protein [Actinomycetota bacterium]